MEIDMGIGGLEFGSGVTRSPGLVFVVVNTTHPPIITKHYRINHFLGFKLVNSCPLNPNCIFHPALLEQ